MRPVNLIPEDVKRRTDRQPTGVAPYFVIATLVLVAAGAGVYVMIENRLTSKHDKLADVSAQVDEVNAQADALAEYGRFADLLRTRQAALVTVAGAGFPWDEVLLDISRALPGDAWLVNIKAKISPNAKTGDKEGSDSGSGGGGGGGGGAGGEEEGVKDDQLPGPRMKLEGCSYRQTDVAEMMADLRNISGVKQVMLAKSEVLAGNSSGSSEDSTEDCRTNAKIHKFTLVLTFAPGLGSILAEAANGGTGLGGAAEAGGAQGGGSGSGSESSPKGDESGGGTPESSPPPGSAGEPVSGVGP